MTETQELMDAPNKYREKAGFGGPCKKKEKAVDRILNRKDTDEVDPSVDAPVPKQLSPKRRRAQLLWRRQNG